MNSPPEASIKVDVRGERAISRAARFVSLSEGEMRRVVVFFFSALAVRSAAVVVNPERKLQSSVESD